MTNTDTGSDNLSTPASGDDSDVSPSVSDACTGALVDHATTKLHHTVQLQRVEFRVRWTDSTGRPHSIASCSEEFRVRNYAQTLQNMYPGEGPYHIERRNYVSFVTGWEEIR